LGFAQAGTSSHENRCCRPQAHGLQKMNKNTKQSDRYGKVSKLRGPDTASPKDGVRLIKAFLEIKEPGWREKLIRLAEDLAKASSYGLATAQVERRTTNARSTVLVFLRNCGSDR
jgi:hypothetical protein